MNFDSEKIVTARLKTASWIGWILVAVNFPTVSWLLRPYPSVDELTLLSAVLWIAGVIAAGWSVGGFAWNALLAKSEHALDEPMWERSKGGVNLFEEKVQFLSNSSRTTRNWAVGLLLVGIFLVAASWGDQNAVSCQFNADGDVSCRNSLAYGSLFVLAGVIFLSLWGFYSQRFMQYFNYLEPKIRDARESKARGDDDLDPFSLDN